MTDLQKTFVLSITLVLIAGCASTVRVVNGKQSTDNPTNAASQGPEPRREIYRVQTVELVEAIDSTNNALEAQSGFGISDIFAELIRRADLAFEGVDGAVITLKRPQYVHWMPISELDSMLARPGLRKELAVVVIGEWSGPVEGREWKIPEQFASEVKYKLRNAGFKHVVFAAKDRGLYQRTSVGSLWDCDSNRVAEMIKAINSSDANFYAKFDFGESDVLGWLFRCADVAFRTDGEVIKLAQPEPPALMPVAELDRILAKRGLRKELAVVFIEQFRPMYFRQEHDEKAKEGESLEIDRGHEVPRNFESDLDEKLRGAGFKQVIFAHKNNHGFRQRMWVPTKNPK